MKKIFFGILIVFLFQNKNHAQCLHLGADLSYVNAVEQNGGTFFDENGIQVDPYEFFASKGATMLRMRLWHTPEYLIDHCGNAISNNNLVDVITAFQRGKAAGLQLKLSIHYSDYFADPGKQKMPKIWEGLAHSDLVNSIYAYTYFVLENLKNNNVLPNIVAVGNETTWGFVDATAQTDGWNWAEDADKFNAGLSAIQDFNNNENTSIQRAVHFPEKSATWTMSELQNNGVTDFEMIGLSFYPSWTEFQSIAELGDLISFLKNNYQKEVMVFETGAPWTTASADNYNNIMNNYGNLNYSVSKASQQQFLLDLATEVLAHGGAGILYWEPAWISSNLCDEWGQGSSYENITFFDFQNNNKALPAFDFFDFCNLVAVDKNLESNDFEVFPNPNSDSLIFIKSDEVFEKWELLNLEGRQVASGQFENPKSNFSISFPTKERGVYLLLLTNWEGKVFTKKIIINP